MSNRHGKFYVSIVIMNPEEDPTIAISGPFDTERQADQYLSRWYRAAKKRRLKGQEVLITDTASVPADVRAFITSDLTRAIKQHGTEGLKGKIFYRRLQ
jgi:hypothetical protein